MSASFIPNILVSGFQSAREYLTPVLTASQFYEKGQLTPEEFVLAGDYLIKLSPCWSWGHCDETRIKSYLPRDKQFLIIKNLPCRRRIQSMNISNNYERDIISVHATTEIPDLPHSPVSISSVRSIHTEDHADDVIDNIEHEDKKELKQEIKVEENEDEYGDLSNYMDESVNIIDTAAIAHPSLHDNHGDDTTRTYELTIVYDNYYRTPRVYLRGFSVEGCPLNANETMEDIMQDYVNKTATIETHPYIGSHYLSIHPCRHADTMKRIVDTIIANNNGKLPPIQLYMFLFVKFIGSMIPTIEYDNTIPVSLE
jgi:ubiquitin-like-conjugating enzyme ATG3